MDKNKKMKVLIIEDDSYISDMYKIKLEADDFEAVIASDGMTGMKMLRRQRPDAVLLDIIMPKMDGFSILKSIKEDPKLKEVPVILLTNLSQKENIKRGFDLGAADYVIKAHFTPSEVVKKVKNVLARKHINI
jgi:DNA-binding response OmpR family regulator